MNIYIKIQVWIYVLFFLIGCKTNDVIIKPKQKLIYSAVENRSDIRPIIYIEHLYPKSAFSQGVQGYCRVSFDISREKMSKPFNIKILECSPLGVFESSCTSAINKWLFKAVSSLNTKETEKGLITTCKYEIK